MKRKEYDCLPADGSVPCPDCGGRHIVELEFCQCPPGTHINLWHHLCLEIGAMDDRVLAASAMIDDRKPKLEDMQCANCGRTWTAFFPLGQEALAAECPTCRNMRGYKLTGMDDGSVAEAKGEK